MLKQIIISYVIKMIFIRFDKNYVLISIFVVSVRNGVNKMHI